MGKRLARVKTFTFLIHVNLNYPDLNFHLLGEGATHLTSFLCPTSVSKLMNATKILKFEKEDASNGFYTMELFFLSPDFSSEHSEIFPTIFYMPC